MQHQQSARRNWMVMLVLMLVVSFAVTACGGGGSGDSGATTGTGNEAETNAETEAAGDAAPTEPATEATEAEESAEPATRIVTDAYGETEIPVNPQRIVVLTTAALDNVLALGVKPVGAPYSISVNANFFEHLADQTDGIANTGTVDQPNLETIASLEPDLIIGQKADHDAVYEDLKRIAPVYMTLENVDQWKVAFQGHADAVNKQDEAVRLLAEYDSRIEQFKADMGDKLTDQIVTLIRPRADHVRIHTAKSYCGAIVADAGLQFTEPVSQSEEHHLSITEEQIADMDADVIISFGREQEAEYFNEKISKNPIWQTLRAVQNDEVHMVNWEVWLSGQGIQSANVIIDDLNRIFLE